MDRQILNFTANEQILTVDEPIRISTNKVNYIEAHFDLGQNWSGYDSVRAVWFNDFKCISTVLDSQGVCLVPFEVMKRNGKVKVNLVGSISENDVLTDRLTSYPIVAVIVDCTAMVNGAETSPITPSQFEQYVAIVRGLVDSVKDIDHIELNDDYTLTIYYSDGTSYTTTSIRGEQGDAGNGIASTVLNPDYTLTITYTDGTSYTTTSIRGEQGEPGEKGDPGEVTLAQLYAVCPTDTASGAIASFPDGQSVIPALSVKADIEPIQNLHGYDKPWSGGAGKNKLDDSKKCISGNAVYVGFESYDLATSVSCVLSAGTYTFSIDTVDGTSPTALYIAEKGESESFAYKYGDKSVSFTISETTEIRAWAYKVGYTDIGTSAIKWAQIELGSTATSWTPYSNICPIYGHTEEVVNVCGVNLIDQSAMSKTNSNLYIGGTAPNAGADGSFILPAGTYTLSTSESQNGLYATSKTGNIATAHNKTKLTFTLTEHTPIKLMLYKSGVNSTYWDTINVQLELNNDASSYHAYQGDTHTTSLGRTVYGGTIDVVSGELVVDRAYVDLSQQSWLYQSAWASWYTDYFADMKGTNTGAEIPNFVSDRFEAIATNYGLTPQDLIGITSTTRGSLGCRIVVKNGSTTESPTGQLVYELATPTTIQLTPQEIDSFKGANNIWASTGEIEVEYRADIGLYIEKKLS